MLRKCIKCKEIEVAYEESDFCQECGDFMFDVAIAELENISHELRYQAFKHRQNSLAPRLESNDKILLNA